MHYPLFQTNESLFPCELSEDTLSCIKDAVEVAVKEWGEKSLPELEAEERLSYSCEKVGLLKLSQIFVCSIKRYLGYLSIYHQMIIPHVFLVEI